MQSSKTLEKGYVQMKASLAAGKYLFTVCRVLTFFELSALLVASASLPSALSAKVWSSMKAFSCCLWFLSKACCSDSRLPLSDSSLRMVLFKSCTAPQTCHKDDHLCKWALSRVSLSDSRLDLSDSSLWMVLVRSCAAPELQAGPSWEYSHNVSQ